MVAHPTEFAFASASAENIKKYALPDGSFLHNMLQQQRAIVNTMAVNEEGVMATGECVHFNSKPKVCPHTHDWRPILIPCAYLTLSAGDNGSIWFWDWTSGHCFQQEESQVQPGSLESEAGIYAMAFDQSGSRLITCEADKTIKVWKEDDRATPESNPGLPFRPPKDIRRF
jgi:pleiotropic regulator 1